MPGLSSFIQILKASASLTLDKGCLTYCKIAWFRCLLNFFLNFLAVGMSEVRRRLNPVATWMGGPCCSARETSEPERPFLCDRTLADGTQCRQDFSTVRALAAFYKRRHAWWNITCCYLCRHKSYHCVRMCFPTSSQLTITSVVPSKRDVARPHEPSMGRPRKLSLLTGTFQTVSHTTMHGSPCWRPCTHKLLSKKRRRILQQPCYCGMQCACLQGEEVPWPVQDEDLRCCQWVSEACFADCWTSCQELWW